MLRDRMLVIHRVESHDTLHVGRRQLENLGHLGHAVFTDPAALALNDPQCREKRGHLRRITSEKSIELLACLADEDWRVLRVVSGSVMRCHVGRLETAHFPGAHRSISPITMSMLALIAMTSERRCPSTIFGIAARLMNDGGLMRQRTGFEVPSETI